ncbi:MAG: DNA polymerase/3'-5' exonuclease PolX [Pirellula sp.]
MQKELVDQIVITNAEIAAVFEEMADLLELSGENAFRIRAYRNGSHAIAEESESIAQWVLDGKDLTTIDGIGSTLAEKTAVLVKTGGLPQLEALREKVPPSLRDIMTIPGVGAKKAMKLYAELSVKDLPTLRAACESGLVANLKGFGEKTQAAILQNMEIAEKATQRLLMDRADVLVTRIRTYMQSCQAIQKMEFAGSYRRGKETVGDLDLLVTSSNPNEVMDHFSKLPIIIEIIQRGDTKMSVRVTDSFQVDLRVVEESSWGAALQYFTGSKEHNVHIRGLAKSQGLKINEYGVYKVDDESQPVAGKTEEEIYHLLGLPWVPPELREDRIEFLPNAQEWIEDLIELADIRGDLHMHTTATDGENTIQEMAAAAAARGLEYIAITDHSKRVSMARGLDETRLLKQWSEIDQFNREANSPCWVFKGIECDILENGDLDISDECLAQADWVTASIHYGQKQPREQITQRILNAIHNPNVHAISHPTGRLLSRREPYDVDMKAVMEAAKEHNKILELNANPYRLDLSDIHTMAAIKMGIQIAINTDAHSISNLDLMKYGILQARRAGVRPAMVLNTRSLSEIKAWLAKS